MSTRSFISYCDGDKFIGNYCHYDGYPEHVGKILVEHYNSAQACELLVDGPQIRNFDHDGTVARFGDSECGTEEYESILEILNSGFDYVYVYSNLNNCWDCFGKSNGQVKEYLIPGNQPWLEAC